MYALAENVLFLVPDERRTSPGGILLQGDPDILDGGIIDAGDDVDDTANRGILRGKFRKIDGIPFTRGGDRYFSVHQSRVLCVYEAE